VAHRRSACLQHSLRSGEDQITDVQRGTDQKLTVTARVYSLWAAGRLRETEERLKCETPITEVGSICASVVGFGFDFTGYIDVRFMQIGHDCNRADSISISAYSSAAHDAKVGFLAGPDSGGVPYLYYGFTLHDELALLVEAGFTPMQALQAATRDAAQFLSNKDAGTIEVGKRADLVLLAADPLADIHNTQKIEAVIVHGQFLHRRALDALLGEAESRAKGD